MVWGISDLAGKLTEGLSFSPVHGGLGIPTASTQAGPRETEEAGGAQTRGNLQVRAALSPLQGQLLLQLLT